MASSSGFLHLPGVLSSALGVLRSYLCYLISVALLSAYWDRSITCIDYSRYGDSRCLLCF